ncbi:recombinase family protein [Acinetobacter puyangensis]|uniref:Putative DNA-invertase from lambdoid prophage Rac n=1 Tax=Acinetobacter puyangensis TaxID=1096779 RepID=A0A240E516_9GAMM|nr:recombinase family protein [Acinetobacter puyangensis]SNX43858.1 putative DNA-invertase from lambdoid prophage Rac [Acinetobacter puyangensis]
MRTYAYVRIDPNTQENINYLFFFQNFGYSVPGQRLIVEEVAVDTSIIYRDKLINLINYGLEEGDLLIFKGIDCLGSSFEEIYNIVNTMEDKKIKIICLDFSKKEIIEDLKLIFFHFLKLCSSFESKLKNRRKGNHLNSNYVKKVGRPEILTVNQKQEVLDKFKKGYSVYALAKEYSVTRTVIQRLLDKSTKNLNTIKRVQ